MKLIILIAILSGFLATAQEQPGQTEDPDEVLLTLLTKDCHPIGDTIICTILRDKFEKECKTEIAYKKLFEGEKFL